MHLVALFRRLSPPLWSWLGRQRFKREQRRQQAGVLREHFLPQPYAKVGISAKSYARHGPRGCAAASSHRRHREAGRQAGRSGAGQAPQLAELIPCRVGFMHVFTCLQILLLRAGLQCAGERRPDRGAKASHYSCLYNWPEPFHSRSESHVYEKKIFIHHAIY